MARAWCASSSWFSLLSIELSDSKVYGPYTRARLGTTAHFCEVVTWCASALPRCRAHSAHVRQSRPDSCLGFHVKVLKTFNLVPSSIGRGVSFAASVLAELIRGFCRS